MKVSNKKEKRHFRKPRISNNRKNKEGGEKSRSKFRAICSMALPGCLLPFQEHSALPYRRGEIQIYAPIAPGVFFELMKNESSRQGSRLHPPNHPSQVSFLLRLLHASPLSKIVLISSRDLQEKAYTMFNSEFLLWYLYFYRY